MKITNELLEKYAHGLCTPQELQAVEAWLSDSDSEISFPIGDISTEGEVIWDSVQSRLFESESHKVKPLRYPDAARWLAAASIVIICGLAFVFSENGPLKTQELNYAVKHTVFRTKAGEKKRIKLKDGTVVTLNSSSQLRVPEIFKDSLRMIVLEGEAYLEVAKDSRHPFVVNTPQTVVRVLGTKFDVKAYRDEKTTTVVVLEGKVQFSQRGSSHEKVLLTQNERGRYDRSDGLKEDNVYAERYLAWLDNKLVFDNEYMDEVALIMERWYGIHINLPPQMRQDRFTGEFQNQSAKYVVEKICYVLDYQYEIKDRQVRIYKSH